MISPRWDWLFADATGARVRAPLSPAFTSRFDAEEWLGSTWRQLAGEGIARAVLRHDGEEVDRVDLPSIDTD